MSLRDELKEGMAVAVEAHGGKLTVEAVRDEDWAREKHPHACPGTLAQAKAALSVCDEYEEVEVRPSTCDVLTWFPENSDQYISTDSSCFTILRRKQKPDVTELARRAVKAWRSPAPVFGAAMEALAEAVDK